jgi:hypothetical protein
MLPDDERAVWPLAWANAGLHAVALIGSAVLLQPGTTLAAPYERTAFLATRPLGWSLGWALWMACTAALLAFVAAVSSRLPGRVWGLVATSLVAAGAAIDFLCQTLLITILPRMAVEGPTPLFLLVERALTTGSMVAANNLYSLGVLVTSLRLDATSPAARRARWLGIATACGGALLTAAGLADNPRYLLFVSPPLIALVVLWTLATARALEPARPR